MAPEAAPRVSSLSKTAGEARWRGPLPLPGPESRVPLSSLQCRGVRAFGRRGAWVWRRSGSESGCDGVPVASRPGLPRRQQLAGPRAPRGPARARRPRPRTLGLPAKGRGRPGPRAGKSQDSASGSGADGGGMERGAGRSAAAPPAQAAVARAGQQVGPLVPSHPATPPAPSPGRPPQGSGGPLFCWLRWMRCGQI